MKEATRVLAMLAVLMALTWAGDRLSQSELMHSGQELVDGLGLEFSVPSSGLMTTGVGFGALLLGGWLAGRLAAMIHFPKITGYLVFGMIIGPSTAPVIIDYEQLEILKLVNDLAIALIALTAGAEIRLDFISRSVKTIGVILAFQIVTILLAVTAALYFALPYVGLEGLDPGTELILFSLLLATIATASSPAVVIAVLTELHARGEMSQVSLAVTVCKDLALVILFAMVMTVAASAILQTPTGEHGEEASVLLTLVIELGGSLVFGVLAGLLLAWYVHRIRAHLPIFVVFACFGIALISQTFEYHFEPLIVALIAGMLMKNLWREHSEPFFETVEELSLPVYCVFFAVAGCKADLKVLQDLWPWALLLSGVRAIAIVGGTWSGARLAGVSATSRRWLWTAFIPQAGVSLVLATKVRTTFDAEPFATRAYSLILAAIVMNEILGPLAFKIGVTRAGDADGGNDRENPELEAQTPPDEADGL